MDSTEKVWIFESIQRLERLWNEFLTKRFKEEWILLHPWQEKVIIVLWNGGSLRPIDIANTLGVQPPTITKMVQRIKEKWLINTEKNPNDWREYNISLTEEWKRIFPIVKKIVSELNELINSGNGIDKIVIGVRKRVEDAIQTKEEK